jgi:hypothetical protein
MTDIRPWFRRQAIAATLVLSLSGTHAEAQFAGDLFFVTPSVVVTSGSTGTLELALFSGDRPFGATRAQVRFDPARLQVVSVEPATNAGLPTTLESRVSAGLIELVVLNGRSLSAPIGSVKLARLQFRANGPAGTRSALTTSVSGAIDSQRNALRLGTGLGAEVVVAGSSAKTAPMSFKDAVALSSDLERRALEMRPPGHAVTLHVVLPDGRARETVVQSVSASAAARD